MSGIEINPGFNETVLIEDSKMKNVGYRRYRMAWDNYPKYDIVGWVPIHLDIETTARCQLKCPGCPSTKLKFGKGDMDITMVSRLLTEFGVHGGSSVKFNWRGEPTLYKQLPTAVAYAHHAGLYDIMLNTNGVAMTPKLSKELVLRGVTSVAFSIDSVDPNRYAKLRPGAELSKVLVNLRAFLKEAEAIDDVYVRVQRIEYPDEPMEHDEFVEYFQDNFTRVNAIASNRYKVKELEGDESTESNPCAQLWQRLIVTYDGWMGPCCECNRFGVERFGRYPDRSLSDMWNSLEMTQLRRFHREGRQNEVNACRKCTVTKKVKP